MFVVLLTLAVSGLFAQAWRGDNRLQGVVLEQGTGTPVKGAKVTLRIQRGGTGGPDVSTDEKGKWSFLGLAASGWNIDVEAPGYATRQLSVSIAEGQRIPPMKIELEKLKVVEAAPEVAAHEEVKIGGQEVPKEVAEAVEAGNNLLQQSKFPEAVAQYEKALPSLPNFAPLKFALARAYYGAGDLKKAITMLSDSYEADKSNAQTAMLLANILLEDGQLDRGRQIMEKLPPAALTDPTPFVNIGIVLMNKKKPAAAIEYFTRAITIKPESPDGYYYRGLASIQAGKMKDAKPDLLKVIALAPDSPEATEAKEYLKSIK